MTRIAHLISGRGLGGPKQVYMDLHEVLSASRFTPIPFVRQNSKVHQYHRDRDECIIPLGMHVRSRYWPLTIRELRSIWPADCQVAIVHKPIDAWLLRRAVPHCCIILVVHGYQRQGLESADMLVAVSQAVANHVKQFSQQSMCVIPNMLAHCPRAQTARYKRPVVFGFLGFFRRKKGLTELCQAVSLLNGEYTVRISGHGLLRPWLYFLKFCYGLSQLEITSWVTDKDKWFDQIDVLLLPSRSETFGLVLLEAMARNKLVIASNTGGPAEIIKEGVNGLLVPRRSPKLLAKTMQEVIDEPESPRSMRESCRDDMINRYGRDVVVKQWLDLLQKILTPSS